MKVPCSITLDLTQYFSNSGGFIAPFQEMSGEGTPEPWDFRLPNVLTISSSGHKFGERYAAQLYYYLFSKQEF